MDGHWVRVPTRSAVGPEPLRVLDTVRLILADIHDPNTLTRLFAGADAVINLVGILNEQRPKHFQVRACRSGRKGRRGRQGRARQRDSST